MADEGERGGRDGRGWWPAARTVVEEAFDDRVHVRSGFLALWAIESCVPLLVLVVVLAVPLGYEDAVIGKVTGVLGDSVFGATSERLGEYLRRLLNATGPTALGAFGILSSLFIVWQLFVATLFDLYDLQWGRLRLGGWRQLPALGLFVVWLTALLGGGAAASVALAASGRWWLLPAPLLVATGLIAVPIRWTGGPDRSWRAAAIGGVVGAAWLEVLKSGMYLYAASSFGADALTSTYRVLAFLPIFFLWMHGMFFSLLLAVVVARSVDAWGVVGRDRQRRRGGGRRQHPDARVATAVVRELRADGGGEVQGLVALSAAVGVHPGVVAATLEELVAMGLVERAGARGFRAAGGEDVGGAGDDGGAGGAADVTARWEEAHPVGW